SVAYAKSVKTPCWKASLSGGWSSCLNDLPCSRVSFHLFFIEFVFGKIHTESKVLFRYKLFQFSQRLLTEVSEFHHVRYFELHQVAEAFHIRSLQAVVST